MPVNIAVILLAAGSGSRFGGEIPKQYIDVNGRILLLRTLDALAAGPAIRVVQPVIAAGDTRFAESIVDNSWPFELLPPVAGGSERAISMSRGLAALSPEIDLVAVHDAARPMPSPELLADVYETAARFGAAVPGVVVTDTIKRIDSAGKVLETPDRSSLRAVQTPQVARRDWFDSAIAAEAERLHMHTDDASLLEAAGFSVHVSRGESGNRKITTMEDMHWLASRLDSGKAGG